MFVLALISQLVLLTSANPFHKYPFVFLLEVGNEELDKINTEQIRISSPGGSLALRYPGIGYGDTIGHVRVTGVDYGTDLKADINDGGPGYNYIVLVFNGNPGIPYDAVVTIQTVNDTEYNVPTEDKDFRFSSDGGDTDENTSAEDTSNDSETTYALKSNEELTQSSSNLYNYVHNEKVQRNHGNTDTMMNDENSDDLHKNTSDDSVEQENSSDIEAPKESKGDESFNNNEERNRNRINDESEEIHESNIGRDVEEEDLSDEDNFEKTEINNEKQINLKYGKYKDDIPDDQEMSIDYTDEQKVNNPNTNLEKESNSYEVSEDVDEETNRDEISNGEKDAISSRGEAQGEDIGSDVNDDRTVDEVSKDITTKSDSDENYDDPAYRNDPSEIDQMFNDEEVHNEPNKGTDSIFYDTDDRNTVDN